MHSLILPPIPAEVVFSSRFRVHAVKGDCMEPILRGDRDYVLTAPVTTYQGEGLYLIDVGGGTDLFRVTNAFDGAGGLCLSREKPECEKIPMGRDDFNERVVGIVVADIRTRDERFLREMKG